MEPCDFHKHNLRKTKCGLPT